MFTTTTRTLKLLVAIIVAVLWVAVNASLSSAQYVQPGNSESFQKIDAEHKRVELFANSSKIVMFEYDVTQALVAENFVQYKFLSPNQLLLKGLKPGVDSLVVTGKDGQSDTIDILVTPDTRALTENIKTLFPDSAVKIVPLQNTVVLTGYAKSPEQAAAIEKMTKDYFPNAHNMLQVDGNQIVMINTTFIEVSRTKAREMGIDWGGFSSGSPFFFNLDGGIDIPGLFAAPPTLGGNSGIGFGTQTSNSNFLYLLKLLEQNNCAKIYSEPAIIANSGRAARFLSGGDVPIPIPNGISTAIQFREFGTSLDVVPMVLENGMIHLEVATGVSAPAADLTEGNSGTIGFRRRDVNTSVTIPAGNTIAIGGLIQQNVDTVVKGVPLLKDIPYVGALFRNSRSSFNEVELIVLLTPQLVSSVPQEEVAYDTMCMPVQPNDADFYFRAYKEVPPGPCSANYGTILPQETHGGSVQQNGEAIPVPAESVQPLPPMPQGETQGQGPSGNSQVQRLPNMPQRSIYEPTLSPPSSRRLGEEQYRGGTRTY